MLNPFRRTRRKRNRSKKLKYLVWGFRIGLVLLALDIFYLIHIWPDWQKFNQGGIAASRFIEQYQQKRKQDKSLPHLRWHPVPLRKIPRHVQRAAIIGEDSRFYFHQGFDLVAFQEAMDYNLENMDMKYGASTLSQQTVKNMFFSASRDPLRKWHELIFTIAMEFNVSKDRILETYLNIAEFGKGIYGVQAAAMHYWGKPVSRLTPYEAAQLAASLPSPRRHNPFSRTKPFQRRTTKILRYMK